MKLRIFTDGACSGNPGPGGWAAIFNFLDCTKKLSGYEIETTNNRMELLAVVKSLKKVADIKAELLKDGYDEIEIHSDSAYVVNAVNKEWILNWKKNNWKTSKGEDVKNSELWKRLDVLLNMDLRISFVKVKGHNGNMFNEMADEEARLNSEKAKKEKSNIAN